MQISTFLHFNRCCRACYARIATLACNFLIKHTLTETVWNSQCAETALEFPTFRKFCPKSSPSTTAGFRVHRQLGALVLILSLVTEVFTSGKCAVHLCHQPLYMPAKANCYAIYMWSNNITLKLCTIMQKKAVEYESTRDEWQ